MVSDTAAGRPRTLARFGAPASLLLDALRGGAAQVVVLGHAAALLGLWPALRPPHVPHVQDAAVLVFFVLSGLLITHSVRGKLTSFRGTFGPRDFLIDRLGRIYTAYLPALVLVAVADAVGRHLVPEFFTRYTAAGGPATFVANLFMLQDFPGLADLVGRAGLPPETVTAYGTGRPLWTVAVEWWIYLAVAALLLVRRLVHRRSWGWLVVALVPAAVTAVVPAVNLLGGRGDGLFTVWLLGAAISYLWPALARTRVPRRVWLSLGAGLGTVACVALIAFAEEAYDLRFATAIALALALALAGLPDVARADAVDGPGDGAGGARRDLWRRCTVYVASYSFTLYLVHYTVMLLIRGWMEPSVTTFVTFVVVSNLVAVVVAAGTERHYPTVRRWLRATSAR